MATASHAFILDALNLNAYSEREQERLLLALSDAIFKSALMRLMARMDDATRDEFAALVDADAAPGVVDDFLAKRVPDADRAVSEAFDDLAADLAALDIPARK